MNLDLDLPNSGEQHMNTAEFLNSVCGALQRDPGTLTLQDTVDTVPEWDSLGHLAIMAMVDSQLSVSVESEEMQTFTSLKTLVEQLKTHGALED